MLSLFLYPEDGGAKFLRKPVSMLSHSEMQQSSAELQIRCTMMSRDRYVIEGIVYTKIKIRRFV
jgi:hypothetical protein